MKYIKIVGDSSVAISSCNRYLILISEIEMIEIWNLFTMKKIGQRVNKDHKLIKGSP